MRRILGSNFSEWAALRFGIRQFRTSVTDNHARSRINQRFPRELSAPTAAIEMRCHHRPGALGFLARATTRRWAGSLGMASHAGREVLRFWWATGRAAFSPAVSNLNCARPHLAW